ncbi:MAG: class I SAM-dependent methyltransferase [Clostridia bacterium]|nr:class I SAM-dependent methyltransferase [Clostridia bacterium]
MGFYEEISRYYDYIFPIGEQQLNFIKQSVGTPPKTVLDVACGSGGYSVELSKGGYNVKATDVDEKMVEMAREKAGKQNLDMHVFRSDMRELQDMDGDKFDCIFCIGNSIVHLGSLEDIYRALERMYNLLQKEAKLILQIINYDRIINQGITGLPTIKNDEVGLEFIRNYQYIREKQLIVFHTVLTVNEENGEKRFENAIELLPVLKSDMVQVLERAGFKELELYGDFNYTPYNENSYMLVVKAVK